MKMVPLGDACDIVVGRTPARDSTEYWGQGHPWLSIADMKQGRQIYSTKEEITRSGAERGRRISAGTVLLSFKLSIGKVGIAKVPLYTNEAIAALPIRGDVDLDERYLMWALESMDLGGGANRAAMGSTLNKAMLASIMIPLPPLAEQRRIAAILDQADAIRTKRRQILAHLDDLSQSIFRDMFGSRTDRVVPASVLMPEMRNGLSPATNGSFHAKVLTLSAVTQGEFDPTSVKRGDFAVEPPSGKRVSSLDLLMCRGNGNPNLVGVGVASPVDRPDLVFPDTVIAGTVNPDTVIMSYLVAAWNQAETRNQILLSARTTNGTYKVNQQSLGSVGVALPPLDLQRRFADRTAAIERARTMVRGTVAADNELFASFQSRAFRGEL